MQNSLSLLVAGDSRGNVAALTPDWYSDIFGIYLFAGAFLAGLAASTLAVTRLRDQSRLPGVSRDHLYNLGGLLFAFTVFWGYIGFSQYLLSWYGNLPEEASWYQLRLRGGGLGVASLGIGGGLGLAVLVEVEP